MREQPGRAYPHAIQPLSCALSATFQPLILLHRPAHQYLIDALAEWLHRTRIERGEVGKPAANDWVHLFREVIEGQVRAAMQFPRSHLPACLRYFFPEPPPAGNSGTPSSVPCSGPCGLETYTRRT